MCSLGSGNLGVLEIGSLTTNGKLRELGKTLEESISGTKSVRTFQGTVVKVAGFAIQSPIFHESYERNPNILGMGFWSRFVVTFDFPGRKVYLRKSIGYGRRDRWNASGLHLWKRLDSIEVHSVDQDSPASQAGLKKGDVLIELDGLNPSNTSLFDLGTALCRGGELTCVVRRDSQQRRLNINQKR